MFTEVIGHESIKRYLEKAILENRLPQALLFSGPCGLGKKTLALALAEVLLEKRTRFDLHFMQPEGKSALYSIDKIREVIQKDQKAPFEAKGKVFILKEAQRMLPSSANALLKTLEEPASDSTFLLLSEHPKEMLPTILSRVVHLKFSPLTLEEVQSVLERKNHSLKTAAFAQGIPGKALNFARRGGLEEYEEILRALLEKRPSYPELSLHIRELEEKIAKEPVENYFSIVEQLLQYLFMWHRDLHLKKYDASSSYFFLPQKDGQSPTEDLGEIEEKIERIRLALSRNIKLQHCLSDFFL